MKHSKRVAASDLSTGSLIPRTREGDQRAYDPATYDARNQRTETLDPLGNRTTYTYASTGEPLTVKDALGKVTTSIYDTLHRGIGTTDPLGHTTSLVLDAWGNAVATFDALLNAQNALFNELGQDIGALDSRGGYTRKVLGLGGELLQLVDPVGNAWDWRYDGLGRETVSVDPLGALSTTSYDADSRVTMTLDRIGRSIEFTYDDEDRLTKEVWKSAAGATLNIVTYTLDDNSNRTRIQDNAGTITYTYDALDRVESYRNIFGQALTYTYDGDSNVTQRADSLGGTLTSTYDAESRLSTRKYKNGSDEALVSFGYSARGELATLTRYSDIAGSSLVGTTTYARDDAMRLTGITNKDNAAATLSYYNQTFDNADRVTSHAYWSQVGTVTYAGTQTYTYDSTSQLTGDTGTPYSYDSAGNRTMAGYATGTANRISSDGTWTFTHDSEGNVTKRSKGAGAETWTYGYDNRNQVTWAEQRSTDGGTVLLRMDFTYDAEGRRVKEVRTVSAASERRYVFEGNNAVMELDSTNTLVSRYVRGDGDGELFLRVDSSGGVRWIVQDRLGSLRDVLSSAGAVVDHVDYDAWGNKTTEAAPSLTGDFTFTGLWFNATTGLYHAFLREYGSLWGGWMQEDPKGFGAGDPNLGRYCGNGPTNATDLSGLDAGKYEASAGIRDSRAKMTGDGNYGGAVLPGKTPDGDKIVFTFAKAYRGVFPYLAAKGKMVRGVYVNIRADVSSDKYDEIRFLQIVRDVTYRAGFGEGIPLTPETNVRKARSNWNGATFHRGWMIDQSEFSKLPYYGDGARVAARVIGAKSSTLYDAPGFFEEDHSKGAEFITAAIGIKKGKDPQYLGSVRWGFYSNNKREIAFSPAKPSLVAVAPPEIGVAIRRWNAVLGNTRIPTLSGIPIPKVEPK